MTIVGVTGHSNLTGPSNDLVRRELIHTLSPNADNLVGITCLARGADQAFADAILDLGGSLTVVVPSKNYFTAISDPESRERCDRFLREAKKIIQMEHETADSSAYTAANHYVVLNSDVLVAVWDGSPPAGNGGTSDTVAFAREQQRVVIRIWPDGTQRS